MHTEKLKKISTQLHHAYKRADDLTFELDQLAGQVQALGLELGEIVEAIEPDTNASNPT